MLSAFGLSAFRRGLYRGESGTVHGQKIMNYESPIAKISVFFPNHEHKQVLKQGQREVAKKKCLKKTESRKAKEGLHIVLLHTIIVVFLFFHVSMVPIKLKVPRLKSHGIEW